MYNKKEYESLKTYVDKCNYYSKDQRQDGWSIQHYKDEYKKYKKILDSIGKQLSIWD